MQLPSIITIDGPAAAGKSTLGALLAAQLGYTYFDTGVLYRALTYLALHRHTPLADEEALATLAAEAILEVVPPLVNDGRQYTVLINGEDVTTALRDVAVDRNVSTVAGYPAVRDALRDQQRRIGSQGRIVMVGRDVGTVVMPDADLKVFLVASVGARAQRRHVEMHGRGDDLSRAVVEADLVRRDNLDAPNTFRPVDALLLDTDRLSPAQEVEAILSAIESRSWRPARQKER
ncbi:MAG: (d)CMP kinase [Herpetosiphon sp.]